MKICTVVVTYNRYKLLKECLDSLLYQTYKTDILVVNNASTDDTDSKIKEDKYLENENIIYKKLPKNLGGAGGFHFGVKYAQENSYDYVWLMDDDAEPELNTLEGLVKNIDDSKYSAYAPKLFIGTKENSVLSLSGYGHRAMFDYYNCIPSFQKPVNKEIYDSEFAQIDLASFVGILIPLTSIKKIGLPEERFFIHHDDVEYSLRLSTIGKILMINSVNIYHKEQRQEEKVQKQFLWFKKNRIRFDKLWLKYFGLRNSIFIALKYGKGNKRYFLIAKLYLELIKDIILYDDNKYTRLVFATNSVFDGLKGTFDNDKPTKILKGKK
ncbi:glycosyltransferase [Aliarcobacter butzleri]|uniref:glycosyltransferase n=1 Tax=Aliarcobacter butzleri TaxID=28197 RepID=UPI0021B35BA4|nr:glycosyltransferase [Aliarcobacter butzleri]MCT7579734.1 glycosyltransferase [Aliarcobacter butzleri]MCT7584814.1 glycosyltransferase [Aliarcobacter butzleri]